MNEQPDREVAVFSAARRLLAVERAAYLDDACVGNAALRERVEALLQASEEAGEFLQDPAPGAQRPADALATPVTLPNTAPSGEKAGDRIGRYKLLQQIGEGGCGVVYMAEQEAPVRRRVALKVIKLGMDTKQVIARFEAERQAVALMDHPSIAKVLEAGATNTGRPYFVMELVRGIKITQYCDENNLPTEERLDLFMKVAQAVQHAHQKGIIHRDIKPSNVLVADHDGVPVPKIIDFGIAKATTDQRLTDKTLFTAFEQFIGTPAYMSPEQARMSGLDIDTRTDIYSLGVLLYELLTGKTPFDAQDLLAAGLDEMRRTISEREPARPSTRFSTMLEGERTTTAKHRRTDAPKLVHLIRGDLDWIVMKALEKDRSRRYETANGLAMDIQRHLNCEPVVARPPSRLYEFQKTVRRHKFGFAAAGTLIAVLALGVLVSTQQAVRATRAEREQSRLRQQAERAGNTAKRQEQLARESADDARRQQRLALEQELLARRRFYAAQMNLANQAIEAKQIGRALELLETQRPKTAAEDLRTFEWYHLWGLCSARLVKKLGGHQEPVYSVAISPDGKTMASASEDSTICLWETSTGRKGITLQMPPASPGGAVVFTPDGKTLAATSEDGLVRLWDTVTGTLHAKLPGQTGWVRSLAVSPDGHYLVCGGDQALIKLFDLKTETEITNISVLPAPVVGLAFSPDGFRLASASGWAGGNVKVWRFEDGMIQQEMQLNTSARTIAFSPNGKMLATAAWENIDIWDATSGKRQTRLQGSLPPIHSLAWLPDGNAVVSCASDRAIRLWRMSPIIHEATEYEIIGAHLHAAMCLAISADGATLVSGANDGSVMLWNLTRSQRQVEKQIATQFELGGQRNGIHLGSLLFSPDGGALFGVMNHVTTQRNLLLDQNSPDLSGATGHGALSPDGKLLATGDAGTVKLWDYAGRRLLAAVKAHTSGPIALAFSPDGRMLVSCGFEDPILKAWDAARALNLLWQAGTDSAGISALAFSPDDKTIAAALRHKRVSLFDASTGRRKYSFPVERGYAEVLALAFSPDGRLLASGSESGVANLWNPETGLLHVALQGHTATIHATAFSPDGDTVVTASDDQTVRVWDTATGQERVTLKGFRYGVGSVAFSPDGNTLAAGGLGGQVRLWQANRVAEATAYREPSAMSAGHSWLLAELAKDRLEEERFIEAESLARKCLAQREKAIPDDWRMFNARSMLGGALLGQKKYAEAEPLLLSGYEGMKQREDKIPPQGKARLTETLQRLVKLCEAMNRPDQASKWKKKLAEIDQTEK